MTAYERRCRVLLAAFPEDYRADRGEEIVGILLDTGSPQRRWPSLQTAADLVTAGLRVRSKLTNQGRASVGVLEGMRVAALGGLCIQAAFALAMIAHRAHDGILFYAPNNAWSTYSLDLVAAIWVVAFGLVVAGRFRLAVVPAVVASAANLMILGGNFGGSLSGAAPSEVLIGVQMALLGVVPTLALIAASTRRTNAGRRRAGLWLAGFAGLTAVFWRLGSGVTLGHGGRGLSYPMAGGLVLFLFWACVAGLLVMLVASMFDPRLGVAVIVVSLPIVVYQVGLLITVEAKPAWSVVLALGAFITTAVVAVTSAISLRHLRHG